MYLRETKHVITSATKLTFDDQYPVEQFRDLHVDIEYPLEQSNYPGIWVDFETTGPVQNAGIGHVEIADTVDEDDNPAFAAYGRWTFSGYGVWTMVALTSFERDYLYDEMLRVLAFGGQLAATKQFREAIEGNDFIGLEAIWDQVNVSTPTAIPGTPWGTEDIIYETTVRIAMVGEFVSGGPDGLLVPISAVQVKPYTAEEGDPEPGGVPPWYPSG